MLHAGASKTLVRSTPCRAQCRGAHAATGVMLCMLLAPAWAWASSPPPPADTRAAQEACAAFELEECIRLNEALLQLSGLDSAQRAEAYQRLAAAYAAMDDVARSETYWRLLLRLRPELELPSETSPKIMMVFRSVQVEEQRLRETLEEERRRRMVERIQITLDMPRRHRGGLPLTLAGTLEDPDKGVASVWFRHREEGQEEYSAVPVERNGRQLRAQLSGAMTAGARAHVLEGYVELLDAEGNVLVQKPARATPARVDIAPGDVPSTPWWRQPLFLRLVLITAGSSGAVAGALLTTGVLVAATSLLGAVWLTSIQPGLAGRPYQVVP